MVEDGLLRTEGGMGLLWYSREKLGNCVIRVVYKTANERSNSGVYIRIADQARRTRGTPSITASKCRSWTRGPTAAAPARSTRSRRRPPSRQSPASGTPLEITLKGNRVVTDDQRRAGHRVRLERPQAREHRRRPAKATRARASTRIGLHRPAEPRRKTPPSTSRTYRFGHCQILQSE